MYHSDLRCHALRLRCVHANEPSRPSPSLHASVRLPRELRARFTVSAPDARPVADAARDPPSPSHDERLRQLSLDGRQGRFRGVQREFGSGLRQLESFHERIGSGKHVKAAKTATMQVAVLPPCFPFSLAPISGPRYRWSAGRARTHSDTSAPPAPERRQE